MSIDAKTNDHVLRQERHEIRKRREVHGPLDENGNKETQDDDGLPTALTGVALSGGGVRAAAFSLGYLQSLYSAGRLRAIDYLSTVSGGGYSGAMLSTDIAKRKEKVNWEPGGNSDRLEIEPSKGGAISDTAKRLSMHGRMMGNVLRLFSRHLWGFLINLLLVLSGCVAIASVLAYLMRTLWSNSAIPVLRELSFTSDVRRPFFFAFVALCVWLASHVFVRVFNLRKRGAFPFTQVTFIMLVLSVVLGIITFLAISDYSVGDDFATRQEWSDYLKSVSDYAGAGISALLATALIPYLSPKRLLASGDPNAGRVSHFVFNLACQALLIGVPLYLYFYLAKEDISGHSTNRPKAELMTWVHLGFPEKFVVELDEQRNSDDDNKKLLAGKVICALNDHPFDTERELTIPDPKQDGEGTINILLDRVSDQKRDDAKYGFFSRWFQWSCSWLQTPEDFDYRVARNHEIDRLSGMLVKRLNKHCLSNPQLFLDNESSANDDREELSLLKKYVSEDRVPSSEPGKKRIEKSITDLSSARTQLYSRYTLLFPSLKGPNLSAEDYQMLREVASVVSGVPRLESGKRETAPDQDSFQQLRILNSVQSYLDMDESRSTGARLCHFEELLSLDPDEFVSRIKHIDKSSETTLKRSNLLRWQTINRVKLREELRKVRAGNWMLMSKVYPDNIRPQDGVYAKVVNAADQDYRLKIALFSLLIFLGVGLLSNLNSTSLHGVYRDQLGEIWLSDPDLKLSELNTCRLGGPYHLINCTVHRMGHRTDPDMERKSRFTLSTGYCGMNKMGFRETKHYRNDSLTVADAIAISGAAVTVPGAPSLLHQVVLFVTNFRLGQWLPNPRSNRPGHYWASPIRVLLNLMWSPDQRGFAFVGDGGHLENTGLAPLLERRCRLMLCVDGGSDEDYKFECLIKVLQAAREKYGIEVKPISNPSAKLSEQDVFALLKPSKTSGESETGFSKKNCIAFEVIYPDRETPGIIIYSKLALTGKEPIDLPGLRGFETKFPHDPTTDQFLPPNVFSAYMSLGRYCGETVLREFESGSFDEYELPLGWNSATVSNELKLKEGKKASSSEGDTGEESDGGSTLVESKLDAESELSERAFDQSGIEFTSNLLSDWFAKPAEGRSVDAVEQIYAWAIDKDACDQSIALRREFCEPLFDLIAKHSEELSRNSAIRHVFSDLILLLGTRVKGQAETLRALAPRPKEDAK